MLRDIHPDGKEKEDAPGYVCIRLCNAMFATLKSLDKAGIIGRPRGPQAAGQGRRTSSRR